MSSSPRAASWRKVAFIAGLYAPHSPPVATAYVPVTALKRRPRASLRPYRLEGFGVVTAFRDVDTDDYADTWKKRRIQEMIEEKRELRVDTLTDLFAPDNLGRHAAIINPDQQYASIFQLDGLVVDMFDLKRSIWGSVAAEFSDGKGQPLEPPTDSQLAMSLGLPPDLAIKNCFEWKGGGGQLDADKYAIVHAQAQQRVMPKLVTELDAARTAASSANAGAGSAAGGAGKPATAEEEYDAYIKSLGGGGGGNSGGNGGGGVGGVSPAASSASPAGATGTSSGGLRARPARPASSTSSNLPSSSGRRPSRWSSAASADDVAEENCRRALTKVAASKGFEPLVDRLLASQVPVAVVSTYPLVTVRAALTSCGLWHKYFITLDEKREEVRRARLEGRPPPKGFEDALARAEGAPRGGPGAQGGGQADVTLVCADEGYGRLAQLYLGAALRLERAPCRCAVFDVSPTSMMAAHEADMRAVAVRSPRTKFERYEFGVSDQQVDGLEAVTMGGLRGLFADSVAPWDIQPELQLEPEAKTQKKKKLMSRWAEDDRPPPPPPPAA